MARGGWRGPAEKEVAGYLKERSVSPGDACHVQVSCSLPEFHASLVRLQHGADDPAGPGLKEEEVPSEFRGRYPGRIQPIRPGSYVRVVDRGRLSDLGSFTCHAWVKPTRLAHRRNAIVSRWSESPPLGFALLLGAGGDLEFVFADDRGQMERVRTGVPLIEGEWVFVAASFDADRGEVSLAQRPLKRWPGADSTATRTHRVGGRRVADADHPLLIGALGIDTLPTGSFDGKIEAPTILGRAFSAEQLLSVDTSEGVDTIARWDFSVGISTKRVFDVSSNELHGALVNLPARAVPGWSWTGEQTDWNQAPDQYAAIHFHSDDLEDAGWETDFSFTVDPGLPSGVYAVRLLAGESEDRIPLVVRPASDGGKARVALLLPTFTYQAYANSRIFGEGEHTAPKVSQAEDVYAKENGLIGLYDYHLDGSPVYYGTRLVPSTDRPSHHAQHLNAPARLSADLCLVDWLIEQGIEHDVYTDEDLHRAGSRLLDGYPLVITGSHPEYWSKQMCAAIDGFTEGGGNLAFLGGEFGYWVTSVHPENPAIIEVRRDERGTGTQSAAPGEYFHSTTGELGGMWRFRGRPAHSVVGVGFSAWTAADGAGYERTPASRDDRVAFIFEDVGEDEIIGEFGLVLGAAAGYEIDRFDHALGTPPHALLLATSAGRHQTGFPANEEILDTATVDEALDRCVRADMTFFETGFGGAVFSTGSITWTGSLSHNAYENNVSRITRNVVERFSEGTPFDE